MPALPSCLTQPIWEQIQALLPDHHDDHPLGCHRPRISDRVVFDLLINALVFGAGYRRIADERCSATTLRRRRDEWIAAGVMGRLEQLARDGYDKLIGLELGDVAVDGCSTKAPCGGEVAGRNPTDRGKLGIKRSTLTDAGGLPLGVITAGANRHDLPLLAPTLDTLKDLGPLPDDTCVHLDAGYHSHATGQTAGRPRTARPDRQQRHPSTGPSHQTLAGRTHPRLAQHLLQTRPLHRTPPDRRRLLHRPRQHRHPPPQTATTRLDPLPLGHPTTPPTMTYWRTLLFSPIRHLFAPFRQLFGPI